MRHASTALRLPPPLLFLAILLLTVPVKAVEIEPFRTVNRSPLQGYGLPTETTAYLLPTGTKSIILTQDISSIYTNSITSNEQLIMDGEQYRWTLIGKYALTDHLELGLELPFILQGGGFLDGFLIDWHRMWGLPQGGRDTAAKNRLSYRYSKGGVQRLNINHSSGGIGDICLMSGYQLYNQRHNDDHDVVALRSQLKLPTGDSNSLHGSGSTDFTLLLSGSISRGTEWGTLGIFGTAGGVVSSNGDILSEQHNNLIGFGTVGIGWAPTPWIALKIQANINTPYYRNSSLDELNKTAAMLTFGGTLQLYENYLLDIGLSEDLAVATAPDVTFHLGLSTHF